ncbi:MAG: hypothetical protein JWL75_334 [Parcubacteria group bacterium]|nr:hypothetical protein [Parcubacteria group bacterium]
MANIIAIALVAAPVAVSGLSAGFLYWLAKGKIFVTAPKEGTVEAVMRNNGFDHLIMLYDGHHLNTPGKPWFDEDQPKGEVLADDPEVNYDDRNFFMKWLNIYYVGLPPIFTVHSYFFRWVEMKGTEPCKRAETSRFTRVVSTSYVIEIKGAKSKEGIPLLLRVLVTLRIVNPYRAWFGTTDWLETITGAITSGGRNFTGSKSYADLTSESTLPDGTIDKTGADLLCTTILSLNTILTDGTAGIHERYGVELDMINIQEMDIDAPPEEKAKLLKDTLARYNADNVAYTTRVEGEAQADATLAKGTADAKVIVLDGMAKAGAIKAKGLARAEVLRAQLAEWNNGGQLNALVAQTKAMEAGKGDRTILWAQNPWVQAVPGLATVLNSLGVKTANELEAALETNKPEETTAPEPTEETA